jgi:hypothetical protein
MARQLYTETGDKKVDARLLKKLTPAQKAAFEKQDKKHKKVKYQDQDTKIDRKIIAKVKKQTKKK